MEIDVNTILNMLGVPVAPPIRVEVLAIPDRLPLKLQAPCSTCNRHIVDKLLAFVQVEGTADNAALCHECITDAILSYHPTRVALMDDTAPKCYMIVLGSGESIHLDPDCRNREHVS